MEELCTACLCTGRKLFFINETGFENLYSQIINEIPVYNLSELCVRICWECKAVLRKLEGFKEQMKRCYTELLQYVQKNSTKPYPRYPRLQIHTTQLFSYPMSVKEEFEEKSVLDLDMPLTDDDVQVNGDDDFDVKSEETHCEPETFVRDLNLEVIKKRKVIKKPLKDKSKKKHKIKNEKEVKKKVKNKPLEVIGPRRVRRTIESIIDSTITDCYNKDVDLDSDANIEEEKSIDEEKRLEGATELADTGDTARDVEILPLKEKSKRKHKIKNEKEKTKKVKNKSLEVKGPRRVRRTKEPIIDSTVTNCYNKDVDLEDVKIEEEKSIEKEERLEEATELADTGDTARDVEILIYSAPGYKPKPRKPASISDDINIKKPTTERPTCIECGKTFSSRKTYKYHLNVLHKGQNRYPCPQCGKVYQWKSNLGRHIRSHKARDSGELYCETCDKRFASVATYRQHLRISRRHVSENEFSFSCNDCGKKFVNKTRLRDHIDWEHLKKIKFKCQKCNKPFKCHTSLYVHMQNVHCAKDKKLNLCHVCGKSYQNAAKLKYHIVAMHTSETPYQCQQCTAAFGWYSSLYRHVKEVHYKIKLQTKKSKKSKKSEVLPSLQPVMPQQLMLPIHQPGPV